MSPAHQRNGFTLIELLVVITLVSTLIAMLLPAVAKTRETAMRAVCGSNLRQHSIAVQQYANMYKGVATFGNVYDAEQFSYLLFHEDATSTYKTQPLGLGFMVAAELAPTPKTFFLSLDDPPGLYPRNRDQK